MVDDAVAALAILIALTVALGYAAGALKARGYAEQVSTLMRDVCSLRPGQTITRAYSFEKPVYVGEGYVKLAEPVWVAEAFKCPYLRQVNSTLLVGNVTGNAVLGGVVRVKLWSNGTRLLILRG
ncbi:hypothetical protein [Infirmifilum sp. SLHALR2]|nr:MAG: hypothetical protein B7L53_05890 [Thermofilum sp. NZ13]